MKISKLENRVMRTFGDKVGMIDWRQLHSKELNNVYSPNIITNIE
jgi:hypothetical protein